jgi:hypothetical protein
MLDELREVTEALRDISDEIQVSNINKGPLPSLSNSGYWNDKRTPGGSNRQVTIVDGETIDAQDELFDTILDRMEAYPRAMHPILDKGIRIAFNSINDCNLLITNDRAHEVNPKGFAHLDLVANWSDYINDETN